MTIEHELIVSLEARSADRRVYGLRPFSTARDDPLHGRDADRKIGGPRYLLFRYLDEQSFRYNNRATKDNPMNDADRFELAMS
jgi:hypothetical protein